MAMDILSGVLTGAGFSTGVKSLIQQWEEPQHIGHFFIAINPRRFTSWGVFSDRMNQLCNSMRNAQRLDPSKPILIPGDPEAQMEQHRRENGIPFEADAFEILKGLAQGKYDYEIPRL